MIERTLSILKPDATEKNITGEINRRIEEAGLRIIAQKRVIITEEQARGFYHDIGEKHGKEIFDFLVSFMASGPVVLQVLEGENAVTTHRDVLGNTYPDDAGKGTVRGDFGVQENFADGKKPRIYNCAHGSDSLENAKFEINHFFTEDEIVG